ncbi:MAG: bacteriocin biosynthesis protein SagD [Acidobacteria bacterium]|nr:MAG: bacteriocin biosynthesis protein SagD [Acidobacteriota bacterium]
MNTNDVEPDVRRLLELVSPKVGVIRSLTKVARGVEEPNPPVMYQAVLSHFDYRMAPQVERSAAGKGRTDSEAIRAALGEAVEHYCASHINKETTKLASREELPDAVAPPECVLYSDAQYARQKFPYHRWQPQDALTWTPMLELPTQREVFAPAQLVYLNFTAQREEDFLTAITSNGLAAGPNLEFAILNGLYESVERDGFLITWMNKLPAPGVDFSGANGLAQSIKAHYVQHGTEIRVFNVSTDIPIYVMMAVALDKTGEGPAVLVGLGCHLDPQVALTKSLLEVCQVHPGEVSRYREQPPAQRLRSYEDVRTLEDHSAFLTVPERIGECSFLLDNGRVQPIEELPNRSQGSAAADLQTCVDALMRAGCRVLYADLTTPDMADYGFRVVRTIVTGLQPIHFGYGEERLGGRRLFEVPHIMGHAAGVRGESDLNPCPHPLA